MVNVKWFTHFQLDHYKHVTLAKEVSICLNLAKPQFCFPHYWTLDFLMDSTKSLQICQVFKLPRNFIPIWGDSFSRRSNFDEFQIKTQNPLNAKNINHSRIEEKLGSILKRKFLFFVPSKDSWNSWEREWKNTIEWIREFCCKRFCLYTSCN